MWVNRSELKFFQVNTPSPDEKRSPRHAPVSYTSRLIQSIWSRKLLERIERGTLKGVFIVTNETISYAVSNLANTTITIGRAIQNIGDYAMQEVGLSFIGVVLAPIAGVAAIGAIFRQVFYVVVAEDHLSRLEAASKALNALGVLGRSVAIMGKGLAGAGVVGSMVTVWVVPLAFAGTLLSGISFVVDGVGVVRGGQIMYGLSQKLKLAKSIEEGHEAMLQHVLALPPAHFTLLTEGTQHEELRKLLQETLEKKDALQMEALVNILKGRCKAQIMNKAVSLTTTLVSIIATVAFFTLHATPAAPVAYVAGGIVIGLCVFKAVSGELTLYGYKVDLQSLNPLTRVVFKELPTTSRVWMFIKESFGAETLVSKIKKKEFENELLEELGKGGFEVIPLKEFSPQSQSVDRTHASKVAKRDPRSSRRRKWG